MLVLRAEIVVHFGSTASGYSLLRVPLLNTARVANVWKDHVPLREDHVPLRGALSVFVLPCLRDILRVASLRIQEDAGLRMPQGAMKKEPGDAHEWRRQTILLGFLSQSP